MRGVNNDWMGCKSFGWAHRKKEQAVHDKNHFPPVFWVLLMRNITKDNDEEDDDEDEDVVVKDDG